MADSSEMQRLADRVANLTEGYLPGYGNVVNVTFSITEAKSIASTLRAASVKAGEVVAVRPLEWRHYGGSYPEWRAYNSDVKWDALIDKSKALCFGMFPLFINGTWDGKKHDTIKAAKASAQADYEARIRSALVVEPVKAGIRLDLSGGHNIVECGGADITKPLHRKRIVITDRDAAPTASVGAMRPWPKALNVTRAGYNSWHGDISFAERPTDDELAALHDFLRANHKHSSG
jgi:hypothetical protein